LRPARSRHCRLPGALPGKTEATCCAGCQAVAQTIIDSGLSEYYAHRTQGARQAEALPADILQQIRLYDSEELQKALCTSATKTAARLH
jgi:hypothetical protein